MTTEQLKMACERLVDKYKTDPKTLNTAEQDALLLARYVLMMFRTVMGGTPSK